MLFLFLMWLKITASELEKACRRACGHMEASFLPKEGASILPSMHPCTLQEKTSLLDGKEVFSCLQHAARPVAGKAVSSVFWADAPAMQKNLARQHLWYAVGPTLS